MQILAVNITILGILVNFSKVNLDIMQIHLFVAGLLFRYGHSENGINAQLLHGFEWRSAGSHHIDEH